MSIAAAYVILVMVILCALLSFSKRPPDAIFLGCLVLLLILPHSHDGQLALGVLSPAEAFAGFSNLGLVTVGLLFVVAAGIKETGAIDGILELLLGYPKSVRAALFRLLPPVAIASSAMNNTPVVGILISPVTDWSKKISLSVSKLLMPLSFAAILGGMCTPFGTSTNIIVSGMLVQSGQADISILDLIWIGVPSAIAGLAWLVSFGPSLLPERRSTAKQFSETRKYTIEMTIPNGSGLSGLTVETARLRQLPGVYLTAIIRPNGDSFAATPEASLNAEDRLVFTGTVDAVKDLQKMRGLEPATEQIFKLDSPRYNRRLFEAVVSRRSAVSHQSIKDSRFRTRYGAVVLAISREGERMEGRLGDVVLQAGDTLLLEARPSFSEEYASSKDFLLVRPLRDSTQKRRNKTKVAIAIMVLMVTLGGSGLLPLVTAVAVAAASMILTRCCSIAQARKAVDWSILTVIGSALGIAYAVKKTGLANEFAALLTKAAGGGTIGMLVTLYLVTWLLTEVLTNNAAVAIIFPIATEVAKLNDLEILPLALLTMVAASASFLSPFGYQTNLMIYGPGGYKLKDYIKMGLPLSLTVAAVAVTSTYLSFFGSSQ